jgi:HD-GYP domain-containing protein (c-di-GMP phosphodiesterase class II)
MTEETLVNLLSTEQALEAILQTYVDTSFLLTPAGIILDYRASDRSRPDMFLEALPNKSIRDVFPPDVAEKLEHALQSVEQTGDVVTLEYVLPVLNREYWFDACLIPVSASQIILMARDITKCRETEIKMNRQMQQLAILRSIDLAIASGLDLNLLLSMLLDRITILMRADAATVYLLNPKTNLLEFASSKGLPANLLQSIRLKLGDDYAGRVALERNQIHVLDIQINQMEFTRAPLFRQEHFVTYWGVPLMAKGRVLGVLELFHRSLFTPDSDLRNFLVTAAGQAAIAVDSAKMFSELQKSNIELSLAYDAAIEGLSRAMDLRDKETKEHTARVAGITVSLAARLGMEQSALVHLRRGAVLHDVGKLAIPDQILFKPGPLASEEWEIMRRHPDLAVELLSPVSYLVPALEIPHWHHEKWDGTGYPDGLGGEEIPFAARLFALADVYDALLSERPFRSAWSREAVIQYMESESGKHFDPKILPEFLDFVRGTRL